MTTSLNAKLLPKFLFFLALSFCVLQLNAQNGLDFDGLDDQVNANPTGIVGTSNRTVEAWIKTSFNGSQRVIVDMGTMPVGTRFTFNVLNGLLRIEIGGGGINSTVTVSDGNWHHVAATFDNAATTKYQLYVDGSPAGSGNIAQAINTAAGTNFYIGTRNDLVNRFLGLIDEVRIWNYARTQAQISADMNASYCSPQPGLVAYYKMNQGIAGGNNAGLTNVIDNSGSGNNGTLVGFALSGATSNWVIGSAVLPGVGSSSAFTVSSCGSYTSPSGNYVWNTNGTYNDTIPNAGGCDSVMSITVNILQAATNSFADGACYAYTSPSGNHTWTTSGTYQDTLFGAAANGCDSILTIQVSVYTSTSGIISLNACDSLLSPSGNHVWNSTGQYQDTLMNVNGCDSFLTVFLTVNFSTNDTLYVDGCDNFFWSLTGQTYMTSGNYVGILTNAAGCDSILTLSLGLSSSPTITIAQVGNSLVATSSTSQLQWVECNIGGMPIPGEVFTTFTPPISGNYACVATNNFCNVISNCLQFTFVGIENGEFDTFEVYPNPSTGRFTLSFGEFEENVAQVAVMNLQGKRVFSTELRSNSVVLDLEELAKGCYFIRLENGSQVQVARLVIQ